MISMNLLFQLCSSLGIVVVFRGTEPLNLLDWFTDSLFRMRPLGATSPIQFDNISHPDDLKVSMDHCGFLDALEVFDFQKSSKCCLIELYSHLVQLISDNSNRSIFICGHSLGGALANVFAFMLHSIDQQRHGSEKSSNTPVKDNTYLNLEQVLGGVYTYGSLRCFNDTAQEEFHKSVPLLQRTFRFVLDNDVVTQVPNSSSDDNFTAPPNILTNAMYWFLKRMTRGELPRPYFHTGNAIHFKRIGENDFIVEGKDPFGREGEEVKVTPNTGSVDLRQGEPLVMRWVRKIGRVVAPYIVDHHPDSYEKLCNMF